MPEAKEKTIEISQKTILMVVGIIAVAIIISAFILNDSRNQPSVTTTTIHSVTTTTTTTVQPRCGDGICQSNENILSCSQDCHPDKIVGFRSFDYDKNTQRIDTLSLDSGYYDSNGNWQMDVTGYDSFGNVVFSVSPQINVGGFSTQHYCQPYCTGIHVYDQIPYISGGKMLIKFANLNTGMLATGEYSYSTFDSDVSFNINIDFYDPVSREIFYTITNTGSRIIPYDIDEYVYHSNDCSGQWTLFVMINQDPNGNGIIGPGQTEIATGPTPEAGLYSGSSYCVKLTWGFNSEFSKTIPFTL